MGASIEVMGRDLLYKPPVPIVTGDDSEVKPASKAVKRPPQVERGRDLGGVGSPTPEPVVTTSTPSAKSSSAERAAFKNPYFTKDSSGVGVANQRQRTMQALRGAEGATDLRKVILPPAIGIETPDPNVLRGSSDLMGIDGSFHLGLEALVGRQSAWTRERESRLRC